MPAVFDGLEMSHDVTALKLTDVQKFDQRCRVDTVCSVMYSGFEIAEICKM